MKLVDAGLPDGLIADGTPGTHEHLDSGMAAQVLPRVVDDTLQHHMLVTVQ